MVKNKGLARQPSTPLSHVVALKVLPVKAKVVALPAAESSWLCGAAKWQLRGMQRSVCPLVLCRCLGYVRRLGKMSSVALSIAAAVNDWQQQTKWWHYQLQEQLARYLPRFQYTCLY